MNKREFFLGAVNAGAVLTTAWNVSAFGLVKEGPEDYQKDLYAWRIVQLPNGFFFVSPDTGKLEKIEDAVAGKPLFKAQEPLELRAGDLVNVGEDILTTYGNALANALMLVYATGNKIPFIKGRFSARDVEKIHKARWGERAPVQRPATDEDLASNPSNEQILSPVITQKDADGFVTIESHGEVNRYQRGVIDLQTPIYYDEHLRYREGACSLVAYTQLFTPAYTPKSLVAPPGIAEERAKLVQAYKGRLHDRAVIAEISAKLQAIDAAWLKGDRSEGFLISNKSRKVVRTKLFLTYGAESGIEEKVDVDFIERSLSEGWDMEKLPQMNNALRAGSYNRGKQTELGGEAFKDLLTASSNLKATEDDCGSVVGLPVVYDSPHDLVGFSVVENGQTIKVTPENVGTYLGKLVAVRSSMTCLLGKTDYCKTCLGDRLATNEAGLSMAITELGSAFMGAFMSAMHGRSNEVAKLDWKAQIT